MSKAQSECFSVQHQIVVLNAVKKRMLFLASEITSDRSVIEDLSDLIDCFIEEFVMSHSTGKLNFNEVNEYALMTFEDIEGGLQNYFHKTKAVMGPLKRLFLWISLKKAERRMQKITSISKAVLVKNQM